MRNKLVRSIFFVVTIVFSLSGCDIKCQRETDFNALNDIQSYIFEYHKAAFERDVFPKEGKPTVYVDFSDGLVQAYANPTNLSMVDALAQKLIDSDKSYNWYGLGQKEFGGIGKLEFSDARELYNKVKDPANYKDIMAPIEETLKEITEAKNDALLITDFEEYTPDGKEQTFSYAKTYFTKWLNEGNSIAFHYNTFKEINPLTKLETTKNLYFVVFTYGQAEAGSLITNFNEALAGRALRYKTYILNRDPYSISNNYGGKDKTGIHGRVFPSLVSYNSNVFQDSGKPYEIIGLNHSWDEDLDKYVQNLIQSEDGVFLRKLYLNANNQQAFKLKAMDILVQDVSKDYAYYALCAKAQTRLPKLVPNKKKEMVWDESSAQDPMIRKCYQVNTTDLKPAYIYKREVGSGKRKTWEEVFELNREIFEAHVKNDPQKIEIQTKIHSNYSKEAFEKLDGANALFKIDYIINTEENLENKQLEDFKWVSAIHKETGINSSLYESIRSTLQESRPNGVIYSYFIKFNFIK